MIRRTKHFMLLATIFTLSIPLYSIYPNETRLPVGITNQVSEEVYFNSEEIRSWEEEILSEANIEQPIGDWKNIGESRAPYGGWSWRDGVICITDSNAWSPHFNNGHAGIVAVAPYYDSVIEANPNDGVQAIWGHWNTRFPNKMVYQVGVKSTTVAQDQRAAQWATNQIGKPYNNKYFDVNTRKSFYCSQLVWAAYKDTTGVNLDTWRWGSAIHPFELMHSGETELMYRNK